MQDTSPDGTVPRLDRRDERLRSTPGLRGLAAVTKARFRAGELGWLTVVLGLGIIWTVFECVSPTFLSSLNLANLLQQSAGVGMVALGVVLVLLVGQIDLSVGSTAGMAAAVLAVALVRGGWPTPVAVVATIGCGALVGLCYGLFFVRFGVPSFVISLAGLLGVLGLQLWVLGPVGSLNLPRDSSLFAISQGFLPPSVSYLLVAAGTLALIAGRLSVRRRRLQAGLSAGSSLSSVMGGLAAGIAASGAVHYIDQSRGVSVLFVVFVGFVVAVDLALRHTAWGLAVFAIGGNAQAAERAGIKVRRVYVGVFTLCSSFAALGGVMLAARLGAAAQSTGGGDTNLNAIAAAVIGGTSLFGGRGSAYSALLGILVIWSISSGLNLIQVEASVRFMITGAVLLLAVTVDSLARREGALRR